MGGRQAGQRVTERSPDGWPAGGQAGWGAGTGLRGVEQRLAAFDGVLSVSSPLGGPTVATLERALRRVAAGGTALDPEVVARLLARNYGNAALAALSPREREVLALMAEGRSNSAIAQQLVITEGAVTKHTKSIFFKLDLLPSDDDNRRVLAVLANLGR